jgi:hypothetical protein
MKNNTQGPIIAELKKPQKAKRASLKEIVCNDFAGARISGFTFDGTIDLVTLVESLTKIISPISAIAPALKRQVDDAVALSIAIAVEFNAMKLRGDFAGLDKTFIQLISSLIDLCDAEYTTEGVVNEVFKCGRTTYVSNTAILDIAGCTALIARYIKTLCGESLAEQPHVMQ